VKISDMNWLQVEHYLASDDRAVVPLGSTEQHAYLSLSVDSILSERVAVDAAEPLGVPVFPALAYGITPYFMAYPGTVSLKTETYQALLTDLLDSLYATGFRRILLVNGHGGNAPGLIAVNQWIEKHPDSRVRLHTWWNAPRTMATVKGIDADASHASWMENFRWTRVAGVTQPAPAPRFSRTPGSIQRPPSHVGQHTDEVLGEWLGVDAEQIDAWRSGGAVAG
jgi:creatinine amidohydrolase